MNLASRFASASSPQDRWANIAMRNKTFPMFTFSSSFFLSFSSNFSHSQSSSCRRVLCVTIVRSYYPFVGDFTRAAIPFRILRRRVNPPSADHLLALCEKERETRLHGPTWDIWVRDSKEEIKQKMMCFSSSLHAVSNSSARLHIRFDKWIHKSSSWMSAICDKFSYYIRIFLSYFRGGINCIPYSALSSSRLLLCISRLRNG